jgi:hypothetical protein
MACAQVIVLSVDESIQASIFALIMPPRDPPCPYPREIVKSASGIGGKFSGG